MKRYTRYGLDISYYPDFLSPNESQEIYHTLEKDVVYSSSNTKRRRNQTYGDEGLTYSVTFRDYQQVDRDALPWDTIPILPLIRDRVSALTGDLYNFCVVQRYPPGMGINPHRDKEMVSGTTICGISLGCERTLVMGPPRWLPNERNIPIPLGVGSLYILHPPTNDHWSHSISKGEGTRISLTFRNVPI